MLVDGAIMNNLPLEQMKELKTGPNVVVAFGSSGPQKYDIDYDRIPGASELAVGLLSPFGRRLPKVPSMFQILAESMLAHRPLDIAVGDEDILIHPPDTGAIGFMDWSRHSQLFADACDHTKRWIDGHLRQSDARLLSVLGKAHAHERHSR